MFPKPKPGVYPMTVTIKGKTFEIGTVEVFEDGSTNSVFFPDYDQDPWVLTLLRGIKDPGSDFSIYNSEEQIHMPIPPLDVFASREQQIRETWARHQPWWRRLIIKITKWK